MLPLLIALGAGWLVLAATAAIVIGRAIRLGDQNLDYDGHGYRVPDADPAGQVAA